MVAFEDKLLFAAQIHAAKLVVSGFNSQLAVAVGQVGTLWCALPRAVTRLQPLETHNCIGVHHKHHHQLPMYLPHRLSVHPHNSCREPALTLPTLHIQLQAKVEISQAKQAQLVATTCVVIALKATAIQKHGRVGAHRKQDYDAHQPVTQHIQQAAPSTPSPNGLQDS